MASKLTAKVNKKYRTNSRHSPTHKEKSHEKLMAHLRTQPTVQAASTLQRLDGGTTDEFLALSRELALQTAEMSGGNSCRLEAMLLAQAYTLEGLFHCLARRAIGQDHLLQYETHFKLALRAQNQCRATLETLAEIKNPRAVAFVKQTNIAGGHQLVDNRNPANAGARARENESAPNKLLEKQNGERLDSGTPSKASCADTHLETLGTINWTKDTGR